MYATSDALLSVPRLTIAMMPINKRMVVGTSLEVVSRSGSARFRKSTTDLVSFYLTSLSFSVMPLQLDTEKWITRVGKRHALLSLTYDSVMPLQLDTEKWITREGKRQD